MRSIIDSEHSTVDSNHSSVDSERSPRLRLIEFGHIFQNADIHNYHLVSLNDLLLHSTAPVDIYITAGGKLIKTFLNKGDDTGKIKRIKNALGLGPDCIEECCVLVRKEDWSTFLNAHIDALREHFWHNRLSEAQSRRVYNAILYTAINTIENIHDIDTQLMCIRAVDFVWEWISELPAGRRVAYLLREIICDGNRLFIHSANVTVLSLATSWSMGVDLDYQRTIGVGAMLHDVGKTRVPDSILNKNGPLTEEERSVIVQHPVWGNNMIDGGIIPAKARRIVMEHHESEDGSGYPRGLAGNEISFGSKIVKVADVYDALTSDRPYRKRYTPIQAARIMIGEKQKHNLEVMMEFFRMLGALRQEGQNYVH